MREIFQVLRHDAGQIEIHVGAQDVAGARRLLLHAASVLNGLDDIDDRRRFLPSPAEDGSPAGD